MKEEEEIITYHRNSNDYQKLLGKIICQPIWQSRKKLVPQNKQSSKSESGRSRQSERPITSNEIKLVFKKLPRTKIHDQMATE